MERLPLLVLIYKLRGSTEIFQVSNLFLDDTFKVSEQRGQVQKFKNQKKKIKKTFFFQKTFKKKIQKKSKKSKIKKKFKKKNQKKTNKKQKNKKFVEHQECQFNSQYL